MEFGLILSQFTDRWDHVIGDTRSRRGGGARQRVARGPPARVVRRHPGVRGLDRPGRRGRCRRPGAVGPPGHLRRVPQPGAAGQDGGHPRPRLGWTAGTGPRCRVVPGRVRGVRVRLRHRRRTPPPLHRLHRGGDRHARRRAGRLRGSGGFATRGGGQSGARAAAHPDRGRRRAAEDARGDRPGGRHLELPRPAHPHAGGSPGRRPRRRRRSPGAHHDPGSGGGRSHPGGGRCRPRRLRPARLDGRHRRHRARWHHRGGGREGRRLPRARRRRLHRPAAGNEEASDFIAAYGELAVACRDL